MPVLLGQDVDGMSTLVCALTYSLGKLYYGFCVAGIILLSVYSPLGIVQRVLSPNAFVHLNKVCYGMFLVHPLVVMVLFGLRTTPAVLTESVLVSRD